MKKCCIALALVSALAATAVADDAHNLCAKPNPHTGAAVSIPADDAVHLDADGESTYPYEQWYWNAVLKGTDGHTYGLETIPFQFNFGDGPIDVVQIAISDTTTGTYQNQLVYGDDPAGYPFVANQIRIGVNDGTSSFSATGDAGTDALTFKFADGTVVELALDGLKNPAPAWNNGIGHLVDPVTHKDHGTQYYYNRRNMAAVATIKRPGKLLPVLAIGDGWYDREFGSVIGTPGTGADNVNWRWVSLHLSDASNPLIESDYMAWDMNADDTGNTLIHYLNEIGQAPACTESTFSGTDWTFTPSTSTVFDVGPPASYLNLGGHLSVPSERLEVDITPLASNQVIETGGLFAPFFEGAFTAKGTKNGRPVTGNGYYEEFVSPGGCCQSPTP